MKRSALIPGYILLAGIFALGAYSAVTGSQIVPGYSGLGIALFAGAVLVAGFWLHASKKAPDQVLTENATGMLLLTMPVRKKALHAAVLVAAAVAFFLLMQSAPERRLWFFQLGFGLFLVLALMALITLGRKVSLTLSSEGLDYTPFGVGVIAWRDIRSLHLKTVGQFQTIVLDVSAPGKYVSRRLLRRLFGQHFEVSAMIFGQEAEWLADQIKRRIVAFGPRSKASAVAPGSSHDTSTEAP
jgi:hypothetical protein